MDSLYSGHSVKQRPTQVTCDIMACNQYSKQPPLYHSHSYDPQATAIGRFHSTYIQKQLLDLNICAYMHRCIVCTHINVQVLSDTVDTDKAVCLCAATLHPHCTLWTICQGCGNQGCVDFYLHVRSLSRDTLKTEERHMYTSNHLPTTPKWHSPYTHGGPPLPSLSDPIHSVDSVCTHTSKVLYVHPHPDFLLHTESIQQFVCVWVYSGASLQWSSIGHKFVAVIERWLFGDANIHHYRSQVT